MRKIPRAWARAAILLTGLGVASIPITIFSSTLVFFYIGMVGIVAGLSIKYFILRCSNYGWGGMIPRWGKPETIYCPKCGKIPEYDRRLARRRPSIKNNGHHGSFAKVTVIFIVATT